MNRLIAITTNTFLHTVRQPIFVIIVLVTLGGLGLAPSLTGWTLDDDDKLLRDIGLSTLLIQGLFLSCFAASTVINAEIEDKTVLTSAAKPISRSGFILGKYLGILGAVILAHYLAGIAFFMIMRHGVMQTSAQKVDMTVWVFGPGMMVLVLIAAGIMNYVWDYRYLPTVLALAVPVATFGAAILLVIDRDWKLKTNETTQTMDDLPAEVVPADSLREIIEFRPLPGEGRVKGGKGLLIRQNWKGPINDRDRDYLLGLSGTRAWQRDIDFLVKETRKLQGPEIVKAAFLVLFALIVVAALAVTASTRLGPVWTFVICIIAVCAGLTADYFLVEGADPANYWEWKGIAYRLIPNFQFFWMIDALSEDRIIPWSYVTRAAAYAAAFATAFLLLGMALFETREVG